MAPLPQNNTARFFFDYVTGTAAISEEHTATLRTATVVPGSGDTAPQFKFLDFLTAIGASNLRIGWKVLRVRYQAAGADFSVPVSIIGGLASFVGTSNAAGWSALDEVAQFTWPARSFASGRRGSVQLYGLAAGVTPDFRYTLGDAPWVEPSLFALNTNATDNTLVIDGTTAIFYGYVNVNSNSYWERQFRA